MLHVGAVAQTLRCAPWLCYTFPMKQERIEAMEHNPTVLAAAAGIRRVLKVCELLGVIALVMMLPFAALMMIVWVLHVIGIWITLFPA